MHARIADETLGEALLRGFNRGIEELVPSRGSDGKCSGNAAMFAWFRIMVKGLLSGRRHT
jgi:hypothetical protein